jgi:hypothetical protein
LNCQRKNSASEIAAKEERIVNWREARDRLYQATIIEEGKESEAIINQLTEREINFYRIAYSPENRKQAKKDLQTSTDYAPKGFKREARQIEKERERIALEYWNQAEADRK